MEDEDSFQLLNDLDADIADENTDRYPISSDMAVATRTLICKIGAYIDIKKVIQNAKLESGKIEKIKFGSKSDVEEKKVVPDQKKTARKNKKTKKHFYNQVTIVIKPYPERKNGVNMKLSENGSLQVTGPKTIEEGHITIKKMLEYLYEYDSTIFYKKTKVVKNESTIDDSISCKNITSIEDCHSENDDSTLGTDNTKDTKLTDASDEYDIQYFNKDEIKDVAIISTKCELIIVSFKIPFLIHLNKLNTILKEKYNLLSIFGTSSYPGINSKFTHNLDCKETEHVKKKKRYLCNCRDMSIFTFRTGKVIITGFEHIDKIKPIFDKYIGIIKAEEANIKVDPVSKPENSIVESKNKTMKVNGKIFEIVDEF
jgi:TATA-box binding protein (TBP) (component of TFIID and TFIIIB)